jgi:hypothetical protein
MKDKSMESDVSTDPNEEVEMKDATNQTEETKIRPKR